MFRRGILLVAAAVATSSCLDSALRADDRPTDSIAAIMRAAHIAGGRSASKTLDLRVVRGRATDDEKKQLLSLYEALAKFEPPGGSLEGWQKDTQALIDAVRDSIKGEPDAGDRLKSATNCASCHVKYRFGRTIPAGQALFLKAPLPELVEVAGLHRREAYVIVYSLKTTTETKFKTQVVEREVVVDGGKAIVKETVKVPVLEQRREAVESTLNLQATGGLAGAEHYRVLDHAGKEVPNERLWKVLKPGQMVLRQAGPEPIDPSYLKLLGPDALVFVPRAPELPAAKK